MKLLEVLATNLLAMFLAGVMGLFFAGAIYLPITGGYLGRVIITLGAMALLYGLESIYHLGQVKACTIDFSVGSCTEHNLVVPSLVIGSIFYALWCWWAWDWKALRASGQARNKAAPRKTNYATAALVCVLLCAGWIILDPAALPADSHGSLSFPARLALVLVFGTLLYNMADKQMSGTMQRPLIEVVLSAVLGFFTAGVVYHLKAWVAPLNSPVDALFSLLTAASTGGFQSVLNLSNAANAFVPALLLWAAFFAWMKWRLNQRFSPKAKPSV